MDEEAIQLVKRLSDILQILCSVVQNWCNRITLVLKSLGNIS